MIGQAYIEYCTFRHGQDEPTHLIIGGSTIQPRALGISLQEVNYENSEDKSEQLHLIE